MEKLLNNKKYQYGDSKKFRAFCEALDEYELYANTIKGGAEQEVAIAEICKGIVVNPKDAKKASVLRMKKETLAQDELNFLCEIEKEENSIRENNIFKNLSKDISEMLKANGYEGKNVSFRTIEKMYVKRDGTIGRQQSNSREFPDVCKALLDPLNVTLNLPTSVWLATLTPSVVSTGEFVIELRFSSCYYDQYKEKYSNCMWSVKYIPSDRPIISGSKIGGNTKNASILFEFGEDDDIIMLDDEE